MSGHSKWSKIKRKKGAADNKRGQIFTKLIKEITVASRMGGGDIDSNPRLRLAVDTAKENAMPKDNIERAIKKGAGELGDGVVYEECVIEGYGPDGVAIYAEVVTDNKNRTLPEIRFIFSKNGGNMGASGSVAWMFDKRGIIEVSKAKTTEDAVMECALDAGALDVKDAGDTFEVITEPHGIHAIRTALEKGKFTVESSKVVMVPQNTVTVTGEKAQALMKLMEAIEDHDDVQNVFANFDIPDDEMNAR